MIMKQSVTDDAFPLKPQIVKPYSHRNLDDRNLYLIAEHQDIEGLQRMHLVSCHADLDCLSPETAIDLVLAAVALHNMLRTKSRDSYSTPEIFEQEIDFQTARRILEE